MSFAAIGAGTTHHGELGEDIYRKALIYTDHEESARVELKGLYDLGARMEGEIGKVVSDRNNRPNGSTMTIFQSLGNLSLLLFDCQILNSSFVITFQ